MASAEGTLSTFETDDGQEFHARVWKPTASAKAVVVFLHGFSDHCERYGTFFPTLAQAGIEVHAFDQRGWGRNVKTPADKGNTGGTPQIMVDITTFIKSKLPSPVPLFLMGHSMGGGEVLYYAAHGPTEVIQQLAGFISIAPWIALEASTQPWRITVIVGRFVSKFLPHFKIVSKLDPSFISHDEAVNRDWDQDPLCHDTGTLQTMAGCLSRAHDLETGAAMPKPEVKSIWLGHGTGDRVTSWIASEAYNRRVNHPNMTFKLYPGAYHCLHAEPDTKEEFFKDIVDFITTQAQAAEPQSKL